MKKFKFGILLLVVMLFMSGCSLSAAERIMEADKNMDELDNYGMKLTMVIEMESEGETYAVEMNSDAKIDNKDQVAYMNMQMGMLGLSMGVEIYTTANDEMATVYTKVDGYDGWSKVTVPIEETSEQNEIVSNIIDIVVDGVKIEEKDTKDGVTHYVVTLNKESVEKLLQASNELSGNDVVDDSYEVTGDLAVDIYINKDNYITSMTMDFSNVITYTEEDTEINMNKFEMRFDFSDFNNVGTVTIPQDVIDNAVELEE